MSEMTKILNALSERDLHPFLVNYLGRRLKIHAKTIHHEVSTKVGKGRNEWLHPDIVGFNLEVEGWDNKVLTLCEQFAVSKATVYSFELKKSITLETVREQFFQAVSNSSWANEGYLVGVDIDVSNEELRQEISRLSSAFGIGVIRLNLENCEESEILFYAKRRRILDGKTMNKLATVNSDFREFLQATIDSITINHPIAGKFDSIIEMDRLKKVVRNRIELNELSDEAQVNNEHPYIIIASNNNFKGTTPVRLKINDDEFDVKSWSNLYTTVCEYMIEKDSKRFLNVCKSLHGRKLIYFSENEPDIRRKYFFEKINMFGELNFSTKDIVRNLSIILEGFEIPFENVMCILEK